MLGDFNGQEVYQRVSYMCLNETVFDQQALDCVEASKMTAPCEESSKYYDDSNLILRKAIINKPGVAEEIKEEKKENKKDEKKETEVKAEEKKDELKKDEKEKEVEKEKEKALWSNMLK